MKIKKMVILKYGTGGGWYEDEYNYLWIKNKQDLENLKALSKAVSGKNKDFEKYLDNDLKNIIETLNDRGYDLEVMVGYVKDEFPDKWDTVNHLGLDFKILKYSDTNRHEEYCIEETSNTYVDTFNQLEIELNKENKYKNLDFEKVSKEKSKILEKERREREKKLNSPEAKRKQELEKLMDKKKQLEYEIKTNNGYIKDIKNNKKEQIKTKSEIEEIKKQLKDTKTNKIDFRIPLLNSKLSVLSKKPGYLNIEYFLSKQPILQSELTNLENQIKEVKNQTIKKKKKNIER